MELELQTTLGPQKWVLKNNLVSSGKAVSVLRHRAISPVPSIRHF